MGFWLLIRGPSCQIPVVKQLLALCLRPYFLLLVVTGMRVTDETSASIFHSISF